VTRRLAQAPLWALVALLAVPGTALATHGGGAPNDAAGSALLVSANPPDAEGPIDNQAATVGAGELMTVANDNSGCLPNGTLGSGGSDMKRTVWFRFVAPASGEMTVSAHGSVAVPSATAPAAPHDTVMAVYRVSDGAFVECNDDMSGTQLASEVTFTATAGQTYRVQIGTWHGFDDGNAGNGQATSSDVGDINFATAPALTQDGRAGALALTPGVTPAGQDNLGAGIEVDGSANPVEDTFCDDGGDPSQVGSTVWYRLVLPSISNVTITAGPFDTVMQLYSGSSTTPLACNDDVAAPGDRTSRIVRTDLPAGTYFIQVGGWRGLQANVLNVRADVVDRDADRDGSPAGSDCDDNDGSRSPGFGETPGNGVDENCDGVAEDRDGDGHNAGDCDDGNAGIHPGASDVPNNGVDEDCSGGDNQLPTDSDGDGIPDASDACPNENSSSGDRNRNGCLDPSAVAAGTPVLRALPTGSGIRILNLVVNTSEAGARITAGCTPRRACPRQTVTSRGARVTRLSRFARKAVRAGATIEIRIAQAGNHTKVVRYRVTRGNFRRSELCIPASGGRAVRRCGS
jgi:hypothetical protein